MSRLRSVALLTVIAIALPAVAGPKVTPNDKQPPEQREKDRDECRRWAVNHSGFDPEKPNETPVVPDRNAGQSPAVRGGVGVGDARKGAMGGGGALAADAWKRDQERAHAARVTQQKAKNEQARANYDRSWKMCLQGRNYTVD